jgi:hypothetical protein
MELQHHHDDDFHKAAPLLSNALAAALKRAYAHHRRIKSGGIEVDDHRVGVPHLVLAILDDPSMAYVMREESFSSTAVKAAMLRSLSDLGTPDSGAAGFLLGGEGGESGGGAQEGQLVQPGARRRHANVDAVVQRGTSTLAPREGVAVLVRKKGIFYLSH